MTTSLVSLGKMCRYVISGMDPKAAAKTWGQKNLVTFKHAFCSSFHPVLFSPGFIALLVPKHSSVHWGGMVNLSQYLLLLLAGFWG